MDTEDYIPVSEHYLKRFRKRIARSSRIPYFATCAYRDGLGSDEVADGELRRFMQEKGRLHSDSCTLRAYKGFIHVFDGIFQTAVTVYRIPNHF